MSVWLSSSSYECGCHRLGTASDCFVLIQFGFHRHDALFIYFWAIQTSKIYTIRDKKSNQ